MPSRIEDYALIGDCQSLALVGIDGSIDWLCLPRFDSEACFASLLGTPDNGRWQIAVAGPEGTVTRVTRRYRADTLILETTFETNDGAVRIIDWMPLRGNQPDLARMVVGLRGEVQVHMDLVFRFGYGAVVPWVRRGEPGTLLAIAGPDAVRLTTPVTTIGQNLRTVADFTVRAGDRLPFVLTWYPSHEPVPAPIDAEQALVEAETYWDEWAHRCNLQGPYAEMVRRSLLTLKGMTFAPTGGILAAATTSLPERIGGVRNWDYRYCWLRDSTFTLYALMSVGYSEEAAAWREWLLRAVAGDPAQIQIMYGIGGERRLTELELGWLPGYEGSRPVRIGNLASEQLQLDVFGEVMDSLHLGRRFALESDRAAGWRLQSLLLEYLETVWQQPDDGIWEVRGPRRHFIHSKVMAWVAFDRAIKSAEMFGLTGPLDRWRSVRDTIHAHVCQTGFDSDLNAFVQYAGGKDLDASLLLIPMVGFLPANDPRVLGTVAAVERWLTVDGLVLRYATTHHVDGLPPGEGVFLACSFWLADNYVLQGRHGEARALFERLLGLANDVGLLAEQYDPTSRRMLGNFPQAFSHVALVNTALTLERQGGPTADRAGDAGRA